MRSKVRGQKTGTQLTWAALVSVVAMLAFMPAASAATAPASEEPVPAWLQAPVVPDLKGNVERRLIHDLGVGRERGMRAGVFAKVGDSNTRITGVLHGFGCRRAQLGENTGLARVIRRYRQVTLPNEHAVEDCEPGNSFSRRSAAVASGSTSNWPLIPISVSYPGGNPRFSECGKEESPLSCELRVTRPRYTMVMTGSNDISYDFLVAGITPATMLQARLSPVIRAIRRFGSVPVLSTVAPVTLGPLGWKYIGDTNREIWKLARRLNVPMINLYGALDSPAMINYGIAEDNAHLSIYGNDGPSRLEVPGPTTLQDSVNLTRPALRYGANRRNLIVLKTLARLDRVASRATR